MTARLSNGEEIIEQNRKKGSGGRETSGFCKENHLPGHWCSSLVFDVPLQEGKRSVLTLL